MATTAVASEAMGQARAAGMVKAMEAMEAVEAVDLPLVQPARLTCHITHLMPSLTRSRSQVLHPGYKRLKATASTEVQPVASRWRGNQRRLRTRRVPEAEPHRPRLLVRTALLNRPNNFNQRAIAQGA